MITIKLFAVLKERAGTNELRIAFTGGTVADLLQELSRQRPDISDMVAPGRIMVSVNQEFVKPDASVADGDEVALMPPFSGGNALAGHVRVQQEPFSVDQELARIKNSSASIGGTVTFVGTTRDISRQRSVSKLEFEHYPGMAEKKLAEIRERAIREYGVIDATIIHRVGTLPVGEDIVLIVVAGVHRDEAFTGCRFCIDELKRITPIWKRNLAGGRGLGRGTSVIVRNGGRQFQPLLFSPYVSCYGFLFCRFLAVLQENHAGRAIVLHAALGCLPAGFALVGKGGADRAPVVGAILDLPAGRVIEQFFDAFNADLLMMDQLPDTAQPLDVVLGVQPVPAFAGGEDQPVLLIEPQGLRGGAHQFCSHSHGIERRVFIFEYIQAISYHNVLTFSHVPRI